MASQKRVLVLGAGFCAPPMVHYLAGKGYHVVVASRTLSRAQKLISGIANTSARELDVAAANARTVLAELIADCDLAISMLPYMFHPVAAEIAIAHKKHFCTTSYVSDAMRALDASAKAAGIVMVNECGVDPGTDHMSAMRIIDAVRAKGGKVNTFTSFCGGLPAPEDNNNPFGYKLSWAPRGVLLASRNSAHFLQDGQDVNIPGADLFDNYKVYSVPGAGDFEGYPNRDSCTYVSIYGIESAKTVVRGTYRNVGWCRTIKKMVDLGLLDITERDDIGGQTYASFLRKIVGDGNANLREATAGKINLPATDAILDRLQWLGLFGDDVIPTKVRTALDAVCHACEARMQYADGEKDMIVMHHEFTVEYPDGSKEKITSTLLNKGLQPDGMSSMSRTVSLPVAIAARMILEGTLTRPGIQIPVTPDLYNPILDELASSCDIKFVETTTPL